MKYLSDSEILKWNKRLEKSEYSVYPLSNRMSAEPYIVFRQNVNTPMGSNFIETVDPFIRYQFTFSVASNRTETFFDLFEKISKEPFGTKHIYRDLNNEKISDIKLDSNILDTKDEFLHKVEDKEYKRFTYNFAGKLSLIMCYISYLEDTINYFSEMWGYTEDGHEVCLLKFPIGTIVSSILDKSTDYLVLDYSYRKIDGRYYIDFITSEMLNNKGSIITYGEVTKFREEEICYSRNSRIDDILN